MRQYLLFGRIVNPSFAVARVKGKQLPKPEACNCCGGRVDLVSNAEFYGGREYGWPLAYLCRSCGARVGTHPDTDIPLGSLADAKTIRARRAAHAAFDTLWKGKTQQHRNAAYAALAKAMGLPEAHISWMDAAQCARVVALCRATMRSKPQQTAKRFA